MAREQHKADFMMNVARHALAEGIDYAQFFALAELAFTILEKKTTTSPLQLKLHELREVAKLPGALRALADFHDNQESQADAQGWHEPAKTHRERRLLLTAEAARIEKEWENG